MFQSSRLRTIFQKAQTRQLWVGSQEDTEGWRWVLTQRGIKGQRLIRKYGYHMASRLYLSSDVTG